MALEERSPVFFPTILSSWAMMGLLINAGLGFNASSCHLLARLGMGTEWPPLASWFMEVHARSLPFRRRLYFYIPFHFYTDMSLFWIIRSEE